MTNDEAVKVLKGYIEESSAWFYKHAVAKPTRFKDLVVVVEKQDREVLVVVNVATGTVFCDRTWDHRGKDIAQMLGFSVKFVTETGIRRVRREGMKSLIIGMLEM